VVKASCPALLLSAPASGQGKTLCTGALARAWRKRGLRVQVFKCGPDFLDPMVLQVASGKLVYNLDLGMCGLEDAQRLLYRAAQENDVILLEGVMGLYDGTPSSADIALQFGIPVGLAIDASAMAQTFGALAAGLLGFNNALQPAGVIANRIGGKGHADFLRDSVPANIPWLGALPSDEAFSLPERHLGLHMASEIDDLEQRIESAAQALREGDELSLPPTVEFQPAELPDFPALLAGKTIAVARDKAFCFIYPANLECLEAMGARLVYFSPLQDEEVPQADAYWFPGGYPELHITALTANRGMNASLKKVFEAGKPILAECGGMMALSESIDGRPGFGLLPGKSRIEKQLQGIGTQHLQLGDRISGHTFHHGVFQTELEAQHVAETPYGRGENLYCHGSIRASFLHFYFPSNPSVAASFFQP
jgi:cobyrinic acid a,c-diamide synthase